MVTLRKAKVTPTASASMLVAMASGSILLMETESSVFSSSPETPSRIIFPPISPSRIKAIQWSKAVILLSNCAPSR